MVEEAAAEATGKPQRALEFYETAAAEAEQAGQPTIHWRALAGMAESHKALGRGSEAETAARKAKDIIGRIAAGRRRRAPPGHLPPVRRSPAGLDARPFVGCREVFRQGQMSR